MKYTTFCRGIRKLRLFSKLKKKYNEIRINNIDNQLDVTIRAY